MVFQFCLEVRIRVEILSILLRKREGLAYSVLELDIVFKQLLFFHKHREIVSSFERFKKTEGCGIKFRLEGSHIEITGILVGILNVTSKGDQFGRGSGFSYP